MSKVYLQPDEVERLERATTNPRDLLLIRLLHRPGCRISEALGITVPDIDFPQGTVMIQHLKFRQKLTCPSCGARLAKNHTFCPKCGTRVEEAVAQSKEHRRVRILPLDSDTLEMLRDFISQGRPVSRGPRLLIFGINRHRAWQIVRDCARRAGLAPW